MNIAETLREALQATGLNQRQLAEKYEIPLRSFEAWLGGTRTPPEYVVNLLLRCLAVDFPSEPVIKQSEPTYSCTDQYGKPLSPKLEKIIREEFEAGRVEPQKEQEQDFYDEPTAKKSEKRGKLYLCTKPDPDRGLDYGTEFRVIKEV